MSMKMVDGTKLDASLEATADAIRQQRGTDDAIPFDMTGGTGFAAAIAGTEDKFITFSSEDSFTLEFYNHVKIWDGILEYSTDKETWMEWDGVAVLTAGESGGKYVLYLRGLHNSYISPGITSDVRRHSFDEPLTNPFVITGSAVSCTGNIEMLLDWQIAGAGLHPPMAARCFAYLFYNCTALTEAPAFPAPYLSMGCYMDAFHGCTSLQKAPALPAVSLAKGCYWDMFQGCTALKEAAAMPKGANTAKNACRSMYEGCTALDTIAELPAETVMTPACYIAMYKGCSSVKVSTTQGGEYRYPFRIPTEGTGVYAENATADMFKNTGGDFTSGASLNTTYYTTKPPVPAV